MAVSKYLTLWGQKVTLDNADQIVKEHYKDEPEKGYFIDAGFEKDWSIYTSKNGAIEFEIAFIKKVIEKYGDTE